MRYWGMITAAALVVGCWGGGNDDDPLLAANLSAVPTTDGQTAVAGSRAAQPLAVQATARDGRSVPRASVRWRVASGGGTMSDTVTLSDGTGRALAYLTLGPNVGTQTVRAELVNDSDRFVQFTVTAVPPPTVTTVNPGNFTSGDVVTVGGTNLDITGLSVEIGNATAKINATTATSLTVVVPACLVPGAVEVRVRVGTLLSPAASGQYAASTAAIDLAQGEYVAIDADQLAACATFPPAGLATVEYLLAPQAATGTPGLTASYRLSGDSVVVVVGPAPPEARESSWADRFHMFLRNQEQELARRPRPPGEPEAGAAKAPAAELHVGDRRDFRVCNKVTCTLVPDFTQVTAEVKYVGEHAAIYQDVTAPANGLTTAEFDELGIVFDQELYDVDTRAFGVESDIDTNGRVLILLTPVVNQLTPQPTCQSSLITGFFFSYDLDPSAAQDERSNRSELFYTLAPDPSGQFSCAVTSAYIKRQVPVTFVHEFQHMISYNQHVLLRHADPETLWLNEAMSHLAEELGGLRFRDLGQTQAFSDYVIGDLLNAYRFLRTPGDFFTLPSDGTGTLDERGAGWLLVRWMMDQFGDGLSRRLLETSQTGEANVVAAVGEPIEGLLPQWFLANYVSDLSVNGFTPPPRLRYTSWAFRTTYGSLNQQNPSRFPVPFPIEPQIFTGGTFLANGTLHSGSGDYYRVVQPPAARGFTVSMTGSAGEPLSSTLAPRLNVIRIR